MNKRDLRIHIRNLKNKFTKKDLEMMSQTITNKLLTDKQFISSKCILLYNSLPDEVNTKDLLNHLVEGTSEKIILLPSVKGDSLELHEYTKETPTNIGAFGIIESKGRTFSDFENIDLAIIPGVAFDMQGNRLGRGKGYYDRILTELKCPTIGICFPFQVLKSIPKESHDIPVNRIIY